MDVYISKDIILYIAHLTSDIESLINLLKTCKKLYMYRKYLKNFCENDIYRIIKKDIACNNADIYYIYKQKHSKFYNKIHKNLLCGMHYDDLVQSISTLSYFTKLTIEQTRILIDYVFKIRFRIKQMVKRVKFHSYIFRMSPFNSIELFEYCDDTTLPTAIIYIGTSTNYSTSELRFLLESKHDTNKKNQILNKQITNYLHLSMYTVMPFYFTYNILKYFINNFE